MSTALVEIRFSSLHKYYRKNKGIIDVINDVINSVVARYIQKLLKTRKFNLATPIAT